MSLSSHDISKHAYRRLEEMAEATGTTPHEILEHAVNTYYRREWLPSQLKHDLAVLEHHPDLLQVNEQGQQMWRSGLSAYLSEESENTDEGLVQEPESREASGW